MSTVEETNGVDGAWMVSGPYLNVGTIFPQG